MSVLCQHDTKHPWTCSWIPSLQQKNISVLDINECDRFESYNVVRVNASDTPATHKHSGVKRNHLLAN